MPESGTDEPSLNRDASPMPERIGAYQVVDRLGDSAMSELFLAHRVSQYGFIRSVALKRIKRNQSDYKQLQRMLLDEARATALFAHPNLVGLLDVGEDPSGIFLALEYVNGTDLAHVNQRLRNRKEALPFELACFVLVEVLRGVHHAHSAVDHDGKPLGAVHRDINPSNILVAKSGHVKLANFGVVRMRERIQANTEPGLVKGRYAYLAPEYIAGEDCAVQADIYAAGIILFEMLSGRECFTGGTAYEVMWKIVNKGVPMYRLQREGVPEGLQRIVQRATAADPERRYNTARDMANALEAWLMRSGRHATSWMLSVFFDRHELFPEGEKRFSAPSRASSLPSEMAKPSLRSKPRIPSPAVDAPPADSAPVSLDIPAPRTGSFTDAKATPPPPEISKQPTLPPLAKPSTPSPLLEPFRARHDSLSSRTTPDLSPMLDLPSDKTEPIITSKGAGRLPSMPMPVVAPEGPRVDAGGLLEAAEAEADREAEAEAESEARAGQAASQDMLKAGKLEETPATEVIRLLTETGFNGTVEFRCGLIWKEVWFRHGRPTGICSNMGMEMIGEHLIKARLITRDDLEAALRKANQSGQPLTTTMLETEIIDRDTLELELGKNLSTRLKEVLDWHWGTFEIKAQEVPSVDIIPRLDLDGLLRQAEAHHKPDEAEAVTEEPKDLEEALETAADAVQGSGRGRVDRVYRP